VEGRSDGRFQIGKRPRGGFAQVGFEFGEDLLD
jgi:hypothetical protein